MDASRHDKSKWRVRQFKSHSSAIYSAKMQKSFLVHFAIEKLTDRLRPSMLSYVRTPVLFPLDTGSTVTYDTQPIARKYFVGIMSIAAINTYSNAFRVKVKLFYRSQNYSE